MRLQPLRDESVTIPRVPHQWYNFVFTEEALPRPSRPLYIAALVVILLSAAAPHLAAQSSAPVVDPSEYSAMRWRLIGPYRAGRVSAVAGIPGDPTTYYMGLPGGGVWKTTDAGRVWKSIFDDQDVASIGDIAVAPSNPNIIIAGSGEQTAGDGVYRSTDAGATWTNIGLKDSKFISTVIIDPKDPNIIIVGVLGHPILGVLGPNDTRGVYKTTDGGKTWKHTLYRDATAGISNMTADPDNPGILYAGMWKPFDFRQGPPEKIEQSSWIYKSTDEGSTWNPVSENGLPSEPRDRVGLAVAPGTKGQRVFAIMQQGLFRSDDGGATWRQITKDPRITGNLYICRVYVDPKNADTVYVMQTTMYRSTDGGVNFTAYKGAPGGDDYHVLWIDPQNSRRLFLGVDQGATISVDGGLSWSTWYNQPTGQFYHVITDNQFPYISYAPQQDSGSVAIPNRSDYGEITYRDWFSSGAFEFCYIAPDPLNPNIVYSGGWYGAVIRFDKTTGQITHVFVRSSRYHTSQMPPLVFSPQDPHTLYLGTQFAMKTTDEGQTWTEISPDLTVSEQTPKSASASPTQQSVGGHNPEAETAEDADAVREMEEDRDAGGKDDFEFAQRPRPGALTILSPSTVTASVIWAGSLNGLVHATFDGAQTWKNVTPLDIAKDSEIIAIEPSRYDANSAYLVYETRMQAHPYIYRTRDAGKTWQKITEGLQDGWVARIVREDPVRKGLLYAGTENAIYVSFDDGDHWQSLQLNFPVSDVRDLVVHGNDIVAATYGRGIYILDDISPLRQAGPEVNSAGAYLLKPAPAMRVRYDNDQETPLPPETPAAKNPPDGAVFYYYLKSPPSGEITLEIHDSQGKVVRRFNSVVPKPDTTPKNVPDYWFAPLAGMPKNQGLNRFVWDLRYPPPDALNFSYYGQMLDYIEYTLSDHALPEDTPREQTLGPLVTPGQYEAVLIANGTLMKQPFTVTLDPRVHVSQADLEAQLIAGKRVDSGLAASAKAFQDIFNLRNAIADRLKTLGPMPEDKTTAEEKKDKDKEAEAAKLAGGAAPTASANAGSATPTAPAPPASPAKQSFDALTALDEKAAVILQGISDAPGIGPINRDLAREQFFIQSGDAAPSGTAKAALNESCDGLNKNLAAWRNLDSQDVPATSNIIAHSGLAALPTATVVSITATPHDTVSADACAPQ
jgi:photosystem II stability/assembly factor-like uncharacterized protein